MAIWLATFRTVKDVRAAGTRVRAKSEGTGISGNAGGSGPGDGVDWWDDVSHQAQRVAHVAAASSFASGGGEVRALAFFCSKVGALSWTATV